MRQNYRGNKKRIEETKRKRKEEKRNKRLVKKDGDSPEIQAPEAGPIPNPETSL